MGVVLQMGFVLMFIMAGIELYVNTMFRPEKFKPETYPQGLRQVMQLVHQLGPIVEANAVYSLLFSIGLSVLLGMIYPMAGIAAFIGGIGSTLLVQPYYMGKRVLATKAKTQRSSTVDDLRSKLNR